ncbi:hypothetical protein [Brevundimonas sp.]
MQTFELPIQPPPFDYFLAWHTRSPEDPATNWLVDVLSARFASHDLRPKSL